MVDNSLGVSDHELKTDASSNLLLLDDPGHECACTLWSEIRIGSRQLTAEKNLRSGRIGSG